MTIKKGGHAHGKIPDCQLAYTTLGTLNARKDNVILFAHMFSQNQRVRVEWHLLKLCRVSMETDIFSGDFARYGQ